MKKRTTDLSIIIFIFCVIFLQGWNVNAQQKYTNNSQPIIFDEDSGIYYNTETGDAWLKKADSDESSELSPAADPTPQPKIEFANDRVMITASSGWPLWVRHVDSNYYSWVYANTAITANATGDQSNDAVGIYSTAKYAANRNIAIFGTVWGGQGDQNIGVYGNINDESDVTSTLSAGVLGANNSSLGHGGHFINSNTAGFTSNGEVGVWAGTYWGNIFEGWELAGDGSTPLDLRFRVSWNGNVYADGTFTGGGADFAESVILSGDKKRYQPGDLLEISEKPAGGTHTFTQSSEAYSTRIAGIYSIRPGFLGTRQKLAEQDKQTEIPMAVVGIVPCRVSGENGPIARGDLLVSSQTPGCAMKGTDRSRLIGSIVGKALEKWEQSGEGVIDVLVTLQ